MTKQQIKKEWKKIIAEIRNKPDIDGPYPADVATVRKLVIFAEVALAKIGVGEDVDCNTDFYQVIMKRYFECKKCLTVQWLN